MGQVSRNRASVEMPQELVLTQWSTWWPLRLGGPILDPSLTGASAERPVVAEEDQEQGRAASWINRRLRKDTDPASVSSTEFTGKQEFTAKHEEDLKIKTKSPSLKTALTQSTENSP